MASFNNNTMRGLASNGKYTTDELETVTMDDGTRIVTSPVTDIKRPVCAGIDVHKSVLMAAICVTNKETLSAVFMSDNSLLQTATYAGWQTGLLPMVLWMSAWNQLASIGFQSTISWNRMA